MTDTDLPALRDRIADALAKADGWEWADGFDKTRSPSFQGYQRQADAVLAVLPAVDREATYRAAWHSARQRARVLSDELARRAPLNAEYAAFWWEADGHRLALSEALGLGAGAPWDAIRERAAELGLAPVDRAAVLREAADAVAADNRSIRYGSATDYADRHAALLRRMADEAQR